MALGVTRPPPRPWGCFGHPHGQESGPATPKLTKKKKTHTHKNRFWAFRDGPYATPLPLRWSGYPKRQKKKKKKVRGFWGWPDHPQRPGGTSVTPYGRYGGGQSHPRPLGAVWPPPKAQNFFFFFFFGKFGGGRTTPMALGVVRSLPKATPVLSLSLSLSLSLLIIFIFRFKN
jgi:hypothetical protein